MQRLCVTIFVFRNSERIFHYFLNSFMYVAVFQASITNYFLSCFVILVLNLCLFNCLKFIDDEKIIDNEKPLLKLISHPPLLKPHFSISFFFFFSFLFVFQIISFLQLLKLLVFNINFVKEFCSSFYLFNTISFYCFYLILKDLIRKMYHLFEYQMPRNKIIYIRTRKLRPVFHVNVRVKRLANFLALQKKNYLQI